MVLRRGLRGPIEMFGGLTAHMPDGFRYEADLLSVGQEASLLHSLRELPFAPFDFRGYLANRRVVNFGYRYDYGQREMLEAPAIPEFLEWLRRKVAVFARLDAASFVQVLINEYRPGAGIGWHRDRPHFNDVVSVSLAASCKLRLRRKAGLKWDRASMTVEPRSAYLLSGPARHVWQHSIPPLEAHRYSITFRTLAHERP